MKRFTTLVLSGLMLISVVLAGCDSSGKVPAKATSDNLNLVWSDEFNGNKLNDANWGYELGGGGWGNGEAQYYTDRNAVVSDGTLKIEAKREETLDVYTDSAGNEIVYPYSFTSSRITSKTKFSQVYGRIEARLKVPAGQGLWPAFWMLPESSPYGGWPESGEIDIFEGIGRLPNVYNATLHTGVDGVDQPQGARHIFESGTDTTDFHVYGVEWKHGTISLTVDETVVYTTSAWSSYGHQKPAPFDVPFYIILNFAIGGVYDGYLEPLEDDPLGALEVDYVRAYQYERYEVFNEEAVTQTYNMLSPADVTVDLNSQPLAVFYKDQQLDSRYYSVSGNSLIVSKQLFIDELVEDDMGLIYTHDRQFAVYTSEGSQLVKIKVTELITTVEQFKRIGENMNGNYALGADLDFAGEDFEPIGKWNNSAFNGVLDGRGYKLKNIKIRELEQDEEHPDYAHNGANYNVGIFNAISQSGVVRNVAVMNIRLLVVTGGGIAGTNSGLIENCYVDTLYEWQFHDYFSFNGGIVAINNANGIIRNCIVRLGGASNDGLVAGNNLGTIDHCYGVDLNRAWETVWIDGVGTRVERVNAICMAGVYSWNASKGAHDFFPGKEATNSAVLTQNEIRNNRVIRQTFDSSIWLLQAGYMPSLRVQE